jgi:hypothetical protein
MSTLESNFSVSKNVLFPLSYASLRVAVLLRRGGVMILNGNLETEGAEKRSGERN